MNRTAKKTSVAATVAALSMFVMLAPRLRAQETPKEPATDVPKGPAAETPRDPKSPIAGFVDGKGPTGPVELKIISPKPDETIPLPKPDARGADVHVTFDIKNYEIFQDPVTKTGQHIHIIFDNQPYLAHYDAAKGWTFKNVPKGTHSIRAFPARPWHESIKDPGAFAMVTFHVGEKDGKNSPVPGSPMLTYSRPKGPYPKSQAEKVMLDFWVSNCTLGIAPGNCQIQVKVDDQPDVLYSKWEPVWWDKLADGKHVYKIALIRNGAFVNEPFNVAKPSFEVVADPAAPAPAPAAGTPGTVSPH